ncbi:MAG: ASKHA domain-containing protein [Thermoguttaceae bacterium]
MAGFRIRFLAEGREAVVEPGTTLLEAARRAGVYVGAICGGEGVCGKCRVLIREGEVEGESTEHLTRDEIRRGYVLACQVVPRSDLLIEVPPESRLAGYVEIGRDSERFRDFAHRGPQRLPAELAPLVEKYYLVLAPPSLNDPTADQERLLAAVAKRRPGAIQMGLKITRELPRLLRTTQTVRASRTWRWDGRVTASVALRGPVHEVLYVERGDTSDRNFGLALDVGTTTVVAHLVDLTSGITREAAAKYNSQIKFGADVISRINYARQPGGADSLHQAVIQDVETLIDELVERTHIGRGDIHCVVAAGNTAMLHFLLGLEADVIRLSPFVPSATSPPPVRAAEVGLRIHPRGILYTMPMVGSFVGGDITAGILTSGMHRAEDLSLFLDIGTNGEVVLGNKEFLVACSASAGPAFEGGSVTCGMRATSGAIDSVRIFRRGLSIAATTIDGRPPIGLCGTGLIDALSGMFLAGVIDRAGRFQMDRAKGRLRISPEDDQPEFVLVSAQESGAQRDVVLTQADVENLIRTKGSIYAAADSLVQSVGVSFTDIRKVYIAGAFGNRLDISSCVTIGLLPDVPPDRIQFIGNSSVAGAKLVMLSRAMFEEVQTLRDRITYRELIVDPAYMERFTSACFLPHTDLARFPSVSGKEDGREEISGNRSAFRPETNPTPKES